MIPATQIPHDWFDWTNFGIGVLGLLFTLWAVHSAKGAKEAATEARNAIRRRGASDAFVQLAQTAGQLVRAVRAESSAEAAVRASDLVAQISRDRAKFQRFLAADSVKLSVLESMLAQLAVRLSTSGSLMEYKDIQSATSEAQEASRVLNEICGRLMDSRDEEGK